MPDLLIFPGVIPAVLETTTVLTPPAPTGFTATLAGSFNANLSWADVIAEDFYDLSVRDRAVGGAFGAWSTLPSELANVTSTSHVGLTETREYQYRISSRNAAGSSAWVASNVICAATAPGQPTLTVTNNSTNPDTTFDLSWTVPSGTVQRYELRRDGTTLLTNITSTTLQDTPPGGNPDDSFSYDIRATNDCTGPGSWSIAKVGTLQHRSITQVPLVSAALIEAKTVRLTFSGPPFAVTWDRRFDEDPLFGTPDVATNVGGPTTLDIVLPAYSTTYYLQMRGVNPDHAGVWGTDGATAGVVNVTTWAAVPQSLQATQDTGECPDREYTLTATGGGVPEWGRQNTTGGTISVIGTGTGHVDSAPAAPVRYYARWVGQTTWVQFTTPSDDCLI